MRRTVLLLAIVGAALLLASGVALAAVSIVSGNVINQVRVVREDTPTTTSSTSFVDIPGAATTVSVPAGQRGLILARFSAESVCDGDAVGYCSVRIVVVDASGAIVEMQPAASIDFAFDSTDAENITAPQNSMESYSMDRSLVVPRGNYTVKAQWAVTSSAVTFRLDDWSLTVEKARV
jgi:hypothetical protein